MKIEIRPIPKQKWHGKVGEEDFTKEKSFNALIDRNTRKYATGLSEEDKEYLYDKLKLDPEIDLGDHFNPSSPHPFWDSPQGMVKLQNASQFLYTDNAFDFIKWKLCKASKYVANSQAELAEGLFPEATHVIYNEKEEAEVKAKRIEIRNKAIAEVEKLPRERKVQLLWILTGKNYKQGSDSLISVAISDIIEEKAKEVLKYLERDAEYLETRALVEQALNESILIKDGHKVKYFESVLGSDVESVTKYLMKGENQDLKLQITVKVK